MSNGKYALCQVVFAPKQKFKQALGFCILSIQDTEEFKENSSLTPLSFEKFGKEMKVLFTGNQNISKGIWKIIGHANLTEEKKQLKVFNYAGGLYDGRRKSGVCLLLNILITQLWEFQALSLSTMF